MRASRAGVADFIVFIFVTISLAACCAGWYLYQVAERNSHQADGLAERKKKLQTQYGDLGVEARNVHFHAGAEPKVESGFPGAAETQKLRTDLQKELGLVGADISLQDVFVPLENRVYAAENKVQYAKFYRDMAQASRDETKARLKNIESALNAELDRLKARFDQLSKQLSDEGNAFAERIDTLTQDEAKKRDEALALGRKYQGDAIGTKNETSRHEGDLQRLQQREALVRDVTRVAGTIVFADRNGRYGYVDLGKDAGLMEGMKFLVYRLGKGGVREDKGEIEVKRVFDDQTQVSITGVVNEFDPIVEGDLIENPFYGKDRPRVVVMIGTFNPRDFRHSLDEIKARIQRTGTRIEDKVSINTDYVILGTDPPEDDANYKQAALLSVPTVRMDRLLGYLSD